MTELEQRVRAAGDYFHYMNTEAFEACREYDRLQYKVDEVRAEYLGICEVL